MAVIHLLFIYVHFLSRNRRWNNWQNEHINLVSLDLTSPDGKIFTSLGSCIANYSVLLFERVSIHTEKQEGKPYRTVMKRCKSKKPSNDMPIDMVEAVLQRLFTMGHGPSHYEGREEAETEEKETSASASPSAKAMSSMLPEEWTPKRLQESMACRARSRSW